MRDGKRKEIRNIDAAIFDLDGTLFDSVGLWHEIDIKFLSARGKTPTAEYKRGIAARGNREVAAFTIDYYGLDDTVDSLIAEWADMARHEYAHNIPLLNGAKAYLEEVAGSGITVTAVTSLARELAEPCLKNNGVFGLFDSVITADETGLSKLSPEIYIYACDASRAEPRRAVAFDDIAIALRSASLAGLKTVAVRGPKSYNDGGDPDMADFVVEDLSVAPRLFRD